MTENEKIQTAFLLTGYGLSAIRSLRMTLEAMCPGEPTTIPSSSNPFAYLLSELNTHEKYITDILNKTIYTTESVPAVSLDIDPNNYHSPKETK